MAVHKVIDDFTPEQLAKLKAIKAKSGARASAFYRDKEMLLAEFGRYYGWQAVRDVMTDRVAYETFIALLNAGRALRLRERIESTQDTAAAIGAVLSKKPGQALRKYLKKLEKGI
jgi:hypothetical protein|nr:MAG TPA: hypothetical protein [Caudoviricetes sp.]